MHTDGLKLGEMIDKLEPCLPECIVRYDFADLHCMGLASYRGYYEDLALGFMEWSSDPRGLPWNVKELLLRLQAAVGSTFSGYKGGDYHMNRNTAVWVANYGRTSPTVIVDVKEERWLHSVGGVVTLHTKHVVT